MSILAVFYTKNRAQDGIRRTFAANTAEEVQLPGRYTVFILTADAANTTKVYFILNEVAASTDPTVLSGDAARLGAGAMTDTRWAAFGDLALSLGLAPATLDLRRAYTLRFLQ